MDSKKYHLQLKNKIYFETAGTNISFLETGFLKNLIFNFLKFLKYLILIRKLNYKYYKLIYL